MKKTIAVLLAVLLLLCTVSAGAENIKHERVYAVADTDGTVSTVIDSVRLDNPDALTDIADRTALTDIENVSGHETFTAEGENLIWHAEGHAIRYQGHGTADPALVPTVTWQLNGEPLDAAQVPEATGRLTATVTGRLNNAAPCLALSVIPVPEGATGLTLENAILLEEGVQPLILGVTLPGLDASLGLPDSFTVSCDADHADFSWMITVATTEPLKVLTEHADENFSTEDAETMLAEWTDFLTALSKGESLPESGTATASLSTVLRELLTGTAALSDGANRVNEGVGTLQNGITELKTGLSTLNASSEALNSGAAQITAALLSTANTQLASAGLEELGIRFEPMTETQYATVLDGIISDVKAAADQAENLARTQVSAAVDANEETIREAVTEAAQAEVYSAVLKAAGVEMDAETYLAAAEAGQIPKLQVLQISKIVENQMNSEDVQAKISAATEEQKQLLVEQNLASEAVQAQISAAVAGSEAAVEQLSDLKAQLDAVFMFQNGLAAYTEGVGQVESGVNALQLGAKTLAGGTAQLSEGAAQLDTQLRERLSGLAAEILPYLQEQVRDALDLCEKSLTGIRSASAYDLAAEGTQSDTAYIIRTVLNR